MKIIGMLTIAALAVAAIALAADAAGAQGTPGYGNGVYAGIKTDKTSYGIGEPVKITFLIQNRSDQPATYRFSSGKQYDIWADRNGKEVWRLSHGRMYTQAFTSMAIPAKGTRRFDVIWKQVDNEGKPIGPGAYTIGAQITPTPGGEGCLVKGTIACVSSKITVGGTQPKQVPTTVSGVVANASALKGKLVTINGTFRGWRADGESPACKSGPPVSRSDWAVSDKTGCIYAHGSSGGLDPTRDYGRKVSVLGRVMIGKSGQPYLEVRSVQVDEK